MADCPSFWSDLVQVEENPNCAALDVHNYSFGSITNEDHIHANGTGGSQNISFFTIVPGTPNYGVVLPFDNKEPSWISVDTGEASNGHQGFDAYAVSVPQNTPFVDLFYEFYSSSSIIASGVARLFYDSGNDNFDVFTFTETYPSGFDLVRVFCLTPRVDFGFMSYEIVS